MSSEQSKQTNLVDCVHGISKPEFADFCYRVRRVCNKRSLIHTANGFVGLAHNHANVGDQVWSLLGCGVLMLLRPTGMSDHLVLSPCYIAGLGRFPDKIRPRQNYTNASYVFENIETGMRTALDPRLERLGIDLTQHRDQLENGDWPFLAVDPNILRPILQNQGVKLESVNLV
ncbi:hypothetical protein F4678DRAFT_406179 [Xylaria arbuscula]|nr:hypothetical protein F4678DRAFT_406179 [Xylaria arbuscula]